MPPLSARGRASVQPPPEYIQRSFAAWRDEYHPASNPGGVINLSIAENALSLSAVSARVRAVPPVPAPRLVYGASLPFRTALARFLAARLTGGHPVRPDHVRALNGATAVVETLTAVLCDPDDAVLVTGPGYRGLAYDVSARAGARLVVARLDHHVPPSPGGEPHGWPTFNVSALHRAWVDAGAQQSRIKMLIVCSPNNPTGEVLSESTILDIVRWARKVAIHVVFDEVYANSVHAEGTEFCSVAKALRGDLSDDVHIVWSFSKDMCLSGARTGVLYTQNHALMESVTSFLAHFMCTSTYTQWALQDLIQDTQWLDVHFNSNRRRLRQAYLHFTSLLDDVGVPYMEASAGFFVWADLRKWMFGDSEQHEMHLWRRLCDANVLLTPASECFGHRYGFFRICFAAVDMETCKVAVTRIKHVLLSSTPQEKKDMNL